MWMVPLENQSENVVIQVVRCEEPNMPTLWKVPNFSRNIAVGISVNHSHLVPQVVVIWSVVGELCLRELAVIHNARVLDFIVLRRLEIYIGSSQCGFEEIL